LSLLLHSFVAGSSLPTAGFSYMYDPAGKVTLTGIDQPVLEWSPPAGSIAYGAANNLNQISTVNGVALSFDTDGNMTSDGVNSYVFDRANRLISAATPAAVATYAYDSDDRRTAKTVNGVTTRTLWSGADELAETDGNGVMLRRFVPGGTGAMDDRAAMVTASTNAVLWFHTDRQGSLIATSGPTGTVTTSRAYSPHGEMSAGVLPPGGVFGYTGRQFDPETGLYQYRARYYSPRLGQFLSADPIGTKDDPNLYGYVGRDPVNATDPTGTEGKNFFSQRDSNTFRPHGDRLIRSSGLYYVAAHAVPSFVRNDTLPVGTYLQDAQYNPVELGQVIRGDPSSRGLSIVLAACETSGDFAERLSLATGQPVWAPVGYVEYPVKNESGETEITVGVEFGNGIRDADSYWQLYVDGRAIQGQIITRIVVQNDGQTTIERGRRAARAAPTTGSRIKKPE